MDKGFATVDVPLEGVVVLLSFGTGNSKFVNTFELAGGTIRAPFVQRSSGLVMIDLKEHIGHGVPSKMLEDLGCTISLEAKASPGGRKDKQYYFA